MSGVERRPADDVWRRVAGVHGQLPDMGQKYSELPSGLIVPADLAPEKERLPTGMSFFAGAGGFDCGFIQAGFHSVAASEWWTVAAHTYLCNLGSPDTIVHVGLKPGKEEGKDGRRIFERWSGQAVPAGEIFKDVGTGWLASHMDHERATCAPNIKDQAGKEHFCDMYHKDPPHRRPCEHFYLCDIREIDPANVLEDLEMEPGDLDCVFGGPPCQGFSRANQKSGPNDPRNGLVFEFCRMIIGLNPKTMVMENVPQLATMQTPEGLNMVDAIALCLEEGGYGTYESLRQGLAGQPQAGVVSRGRIKRPAGKAKKVKKSGGAVGKKREDSTQMSLFPTARGGARTRSTRP